MALQYSVAGRNSMMDALQNWINSRVSADNLSLVFEIFKGTAPVGGDLLKADVNYANLLGDETFYSYAGGAGGAIFTARTNGQTSIVNVPIVVPITAGGVMSYWRIRDTLPISEGDWFVYMQGSIGVSGSGADLIVENTTVIASQTITINSFTFTASNP